MLISNTRRQAVHQSPRIFKFPSTLDANLVRPFFDGEYAAQLAMVAPKGKLVNLKQVFHKFLARRPLTKLKIRTTSATTSSRWIKPPAI